MLLWLTACASTAPPSAADQRGLHVRARRTIIPGTLLLHRYHEPFHPSNCNRSRYGLAEAEHGAGRDRWKRRHLRRVVAPPTRTREQIAALPLASQALMQAVANDYQRRVPSLQARPPNSRPNWPASRRALQLLGAVIQPASPRQTSPCETETHTQSEWRARTSRARVGPHPHGTVPADESVRSRSLSCRGRAARAERHRLLATSGLGTPGNPIRHRRQAGPLRRPTGLSLPARL